MASSTSASVSLVWSRLHVVGDPDRTVEEQRLTGVPERFYPTRTKRPRYLESLLRLLTNDENPQVRTYVSYLLDEAAIASGSVREPSPTNERGFAIFSKPPRILVPAEELDARANDQIEHLAITVENTMDLRRENRSRQSEVSGNGGATTSSSEYVKVTPLLSPVSATPPTLSRPQLVSIDSSETGLSGTSRGEDSESSPRATEGGSPKMRSSRPRRSNVMTFNDLSSSGELTPDAGFQSVTITLTPSPGSERRVSFDALSSHSDGSDSSGRMDAIPVRRRSVHRISSDSTVSVASG